YRSARVSSRARVPAYGWSKAKRPGSPGGPCKSPASAARRLLSSAISKPAIASWRSVRICCTKASTCDSRRAKPYEARLPRARGSDERLQSLGPRRTRSLRHAVPARGDLHRRRRGLSDTGPGGRPILHDQADDRRHGLAGSDGEGDGRVGRRKAGEADAGTAVV